MESMPAIAQLVEHLTVDSCSNQMVPGSIPGGRIFLNLTMRWFELQCSTHLRTHAFVNEKCISRESNPGHIDGNDVFYH